MSTKLNSKKVLYFVITIIGIVIGGTIASASPKYELSEVKWANGTQAYFNTYTYDYSTKTMSVKTNAWLGDYDVIVPLSPFADSNSDSARFTVGREEASFMGCQLILDGDITHIKVLGDGAVITYDLVCKDHKMQEYTKKIYRAENGHPQGKPYVLRIVYSYDDNGKIKRIGPDDTTSSALSYEYWNGEYPEELAPTICETKFTYGTNGSLISFYLMHDGQFPGDIAGNGDFSVVAENGRIKQINRSWKSGDGYGFSTHSILEYDDHGRVKEILRTYSSSDGVGDSKYNVRYKYDDRGLLIKTTYGQNNQTDSSYEYTYNRWSKCPTIIFNATSGLVNPVSAVTNSVGKLTSLPIPTRQGYKFLGWYTDKDPSKGEKITLDVEFYKDTTVYANWEKEAPKAGSVIKDPVSKTEYTVISSNVNTPTVEFKAANSKSSKIVIPDTVTVNRIKYIIVSISANAFKNNKTIKKLVLGKNVQKIGTNAFYGCSNLKAVKLGNKIISIGNGSFAKCTSLSQITIPSSVKRIGKKAFYCCKKLTTITIKTKKLSTKNVGKNALKGINTTATIKVPKKSLKTYKKWLMNKGLPKKAKIK